MCSTPFAATRLCGLCLLLLAVSGCVATPRTASVDSVCLIVAEPPVTPGWVESADQTWVDWLLPIVDYGQRHCGWR